MIKENNLYKVAIVGCGPRGLSALESLYEEASLRNNKIQVLVFEKSEFAGAGPVYDLQQPDSNWLNVSERALDIPKREAVVFKNFAIPSFPDFQEWYGYNGRLEEETATDRFPLRSKLGEYLYARFESIADVLKVEGLMKYIHGEVVYADFEDGIIHIDVLGGEHYSVNEAVISIGHQPIELDSQLTGWQNRIVNLDSLALYTQPYPISRLLDSQTINSNSIIAIRGFGLATIDVLRALTEGMGGKFDVIDDVTGELVYKASGREPGKIVPFSLDGLSMAPKPLNKKIDDLFVPSRTELNWYSAVVKKAINQDSPLVSPKFLIHAIAPLVIMKFKELGSKVINQSFSKEKLYEIIVGWLVDENFEHELILSKNLNTLEMMERFVAMATGHGAVSLDFCIGHVWRHCQPTMYKLLSFSPFTDELISEIVVLDERLKRYSYGPPVESLQQVLALIKAGIVSLDLVDNPNIELKEDGWHMSKSEVLTIATTMINSVLDAPKILEVVSPLPKGLISSALVEPLHDKLGIRTEKDATIDKDGKKIGVPMAILGRLAKGTLIGVDAIAECFGERSTYWAKGVLSRLREYKF